jgi:hypothetical protein
MPRPERDPLGRLRTGDPQPARLGGALETPADLRTAWPVVADPGRIDDTLRKFVDALSPGRLDV